MNKEVSGDYSVYDVVENGTIEHNSFWRSFFSGFFAFTKDINIREQFVHLLHEFERSLRKLRIFALRIDSAMSSWINKIRTTKKRQQDEISKYQDGNPEQEAVIYRHKHAQEEQKRLHEEEQVLIMAIARNPRDPDLYIRLGDIYMHTGEFEDASESYKQALVLRPDNVTIKKRLDRLLVILKKIS